MQTENAKVINDAQCVFRVFGMLSAKHRYDVLAILEMLFSDLRHDG